MTTPRSLPDSKASADISRCSLLSPSSYSRAHSSELGTSSSPVSLNCGEIDSFIFWSGSLRIPSIASGVMSRSLVGDCVAGSHVASAMEPFSFYPVVALDASFSSPVRSSWPVSDTGTKESSYDLDCGDNCPSTPQAPVKRNRIRSLKTYFPGETRRKLDFEEL